MIICDLPSRMIRVDFSCWDFLHKAPTPYFEKKTAKKLEAKPLLNPPKRINGGDFGSPNSPPTKKIKSETKSNHTQPLTTRTLITTNHITQDHEGSLKNPLPTIHWVFWAAACQVPGRALGFGLGGLVVRGGENGASTCGRDMSSLHGSILWRGNPVSHLRKKHHSKQASLNFLVFCVDQDWCNV